MKLRLKKFRKHGQNIMVVEYSDLNEHGKATGVGGKTIAFRKIGDTSKDLDDRVAHKILGNFGDCLEQAGSGKAAK